MTLPIFEANLLCNKLILYKELLIITFKLSSFVDFLTTPIIYKTSFFVSIKLLSFNVLLLVKFSL